MMSLRSSGLSAFMIHIPSVRPAKVYGTSYFINWGTGPNLMRSYPGSRRRRAVAASTSRGAAMHIAAKGAYCSQTP